MNYSELMKSVFPKQIQKPRNKTLIVQPKYNQSLIVIDYNIKENISITNLKFRIQIFMKEKVEMLQLLDYDDNYSKTKSWIM